MIDSPIASMTNPPVALWVQRAVGVAALLVGLVLGGMFLLGIFKLTPLGDTDGSFALIFLAAVALLTAFFVCAG
jgi:hypothetical protein